MRIDPKELPLRYQEQVGAAVVAQLEKAAPVAGRKNRIRKQVTVKRLCFPSARAIDRYAVLKCAVREGVLSNLKLVEYDGRIVAFTYQITWNGEFIPSGIPVRTLAGWWSNRGMKVTEPIIWKRYEDYELEECTDVYP